MHSHTNFAGCLATAMLKYITENAKLERDNCKRKCLQ